MSSPLLPEGQKVMGNLMENEKSGDSSVKPAAVDATSEMRSDNPIEAPKESLASWVPDPGIFTPLLEVANRCLSRKEKFIETLSFIERFMLRTAVQN